MEAIAGLRSRLSGEVVIHGENVPSGDAHAANRAGLAYMTKDRKSKGLLLGSGMIANLTLQSQWRVRDGICAWRSTSRLPRPSQTADVTVTQRMKTGTVAGMPARTSGTRVSPMMMAFGLSNVVMKS